MRQPGLHDLDAAVRVLLARPMDEWGTVARCLLDEAHLSDTVRKRLRHSGARRGSGTLAAEALNWRRAAAQPACNGAYCAALKVLLDVLSDWRNDPERSASPRCSAGSGAWLDRR